MPEVKVSLLREFVNIKNVIWWLSVDNYFECLNKGIKGLIKNILGINKFYNYKKENIYI